MRITHNRRFLIVIIMIVKFLKNIYFSEDDIWGHVSVVNLIRDLLSSVNSRE